MKCEICGKDFSGKTCPYCSKATETAGDSPIPVVSLNHTDSERKQQTMQTIVIAAVIAVIVAAIAAAIVVSKIRKAAPGQEEPSGSVLIREGDEEEPSSDVTPVTFNEDIHVVFEGASDGYAEDIERFTSQSSEYITVKDAAASLTQRTVTTQATDRQTVSTEQYLEETTVKTNTPAGASEKETAVIRAFFDGKFYFDGTMISDNTKTPLEMAMNGSDYEVFSEMEGMDIAIMNLDGKLYLLNPDNKKYTEINAAVKKMMNIDDDTFSFEFTKIKFDADAPSCVTQAQYNGQAAVCYTYQNSETQMDFIAVNGEIKQLTVYKADGSAGTVLQADEFTAVIPSDMFCLQGYSKTNILSFMSSMM